MSNQSALALDALGDPSRRQILELLAERPRAVGEIAAAMPIGRPAVSKHLKVLEGAGLVDHESRGTRNLYALAPDGLVDLQQWLVTTWDTALTSFARYVDEHRVEQHRVEQHVKEQVEEHVEQHQPEGRPS